MHTKSNTVRRSGAHTTTPHVCSLLTLRKPVLAEVMAGTQLSSSAGCLPLLSFLHVPGKMSTPLWLMMGTAFRIAPLNHGAASPKSGESLPSTASPVLFLTAKHTFMPWNFATDASQMKIPEEFRKARFVISKLYLPTNDVVPRAQASAAIDASVVAVHPSLDVAVLAVRASACSSSGWAALQTATPVDLAPVGYAVKGMKGTIAGFRGEGPLGELDTLDSSLLDTLPPIERDALLRSLQCVEGKQVYARTNVEVLDSRGMCHGVGDHAVCYHGMSGSPLLVDGAEKAAQEEVCAGVLYGKHPDFPANIGYTPVEAFAPWLQDVLKRDVCAP